MLSGIISEFFSEFKDKLLNTGPPMVNNQVRTNNGNMLYRILCSGILQSAHQFYCVTIDSKDEVG